MKISPSSITVLKALITFLFITTVTLCFSAVQQHSFSHFRPGANVFQPGYQRVGRNNNDHDHHRFSSSTTTGAQKAAPASAAMCFKLHRIRHYCPLLSASLQTPPFSSSTSDHEIDPRYGVEKRLVPSGPNPLHN